MAKSRLAAALIAVAVVAVLLARTLRLPRTYPPALVCSCDDDTRPFDRMRNVTRHCHSVVLPAPHRLLDVECTGDGGVAAVFGACDDLERRRHLTASLLYVAASNGLWRYMCPAGDDVLNVTRMT